MKLHYLLIASLSLPTLLTTTRAFAQDVSDADKNAARQLFVDGDALQKQNRTAEALDKFERSARVYRAPTTLLRVAQCHAALGHLVEADESYREVSRYELGPSSSAAFQAAKTQAATESAALSPRVPALRVDVQPANVRGVVVTIDDQPLNEALIGVSRPLNPGSHRIAATASGYSRVEQLVQVRERQKDASVQLTLVPGTSTSVSTPIPVNTSSPTPGPVAVPVGAAPAPGQPGFIPPPKKTSTMALLYGLRLGYEGSLDTDETASDGNPYTGWALGGEAALRFAKYWTVAGLIDIGRTTYAGGTSSTAGVALVGSERTFTRLAVYGGYISSADATVGLWAQIGGAARYEVNSNNSGDSAGGASVAFSLGLPLKFGNVRIVPRLDIEPAYKVYFFGVSGFIENILRRE